VPVELEIIDETECWAALPDRAVAISDAVAAVAAQCLDAGAALGCVTVLLCDDAEIRQLNRDFRNLDKPTNVLSFPSSAASGEEPAPLGDIAIAFETVRSEADKESKSLRDHTSHMVVHGMLHLLGYDHENDEDAERMERLEVRILEKLGIPDPYADTVPVEALIRK
jgi:probable rRNA maturation factor